MASLGTLTLDLVAKIGGYTAGLDKAEREAQKRAAGIEKAFDNAFVGISAGFAVLASAGTAALAALGHAAESIADYQGLSEKIGDTAVAVASLQTAATVSGVSLETVAAASVKLTKSLFGTEEESKGVAAALQAIGLSIGDFKKLSPVEQIDAISKALAGYADGAEKTAVAVALFGRSGAELIPILNDLASGSERNTKLTADQIAAADAYSKQLAHLKADAEAFTQQLAAGLIPTLSSVASVLSDLARNEAVVSAATAALDVTIKAAIIAFQTISVIVSDVIFVFQGVGREIGAIAAQLAALAHLDFNGFTAISDAVKEDGVRARKELDAFQKKVMEIGKPAYIDDETRRLLARSASNTPAPPRINYKPPSTAAAGKGAKDTSAQDAKAQLASDLQDIKNAQRAVTDSYANQEKLLEAMRSAGLTDEKEYYADKLKLLNLNAAAEVTAQQDTIARLQQEQLTGKDAIDNQKKIADATYQLTKIQADAATQAKILGIQEEASYKKVASSLLAARQAAQDYFDTVNQGYASTLAGIGKGSKSRDFDAALQQINEKYQQQRQNVANQIAQAEKNRGGPLSSDEMAKYEKELAIINEFQSKALGSYKQYYADLNKAQDDWKNGATEALQNYADESANTAKQVEEAFTNGFKGLEDALVDFVKTGKLNFKSLADSFIADIARIVIKQSITGPLANALSGLISGAASSGSSFAGAGSAAAVGSSLNFWTGGYTGAGGKYEPAGIVHKGEYVVDAQTTSAMGLDRGGSLGGTTININNAYAPGTDRRTIDQSARMTGIAVQRATARNS